MQGESLSLWLVGGAIVGLILGAIYNVCTKPQQPLVHSNRPRETSGRPQDWSFADAASPPQAPWEAKDGGERPS
jgi:hypothetical protein